MYIDTNIEGNTSTSTNMDDQTTQSSASTGQTVQSNASTQREMGHSSGITGQTESSASTGCRCGTGCTWSKSAPEAY